MSSGVPRGGGKNTRQDNVNMASSDGSMQNFPRMGGKAQPNEHMNMTNEQQQQQTMTNGPRGPKNYYPNEYSSEGMMQNFNRGGVKGQFPDHSTMPPNERVMHPGGAHSMQQPQFTAQANVPPMPLNNPSLFLQSGSIKTEAPGYYTMQMGNPNMPPTQPPFAYAPIQQYQQPNYPPGPYYPQSQGYAQQYQPHQPYMNPNQMPPQQPEMSAMTQGTQQAPPQKRERKPLLILDPESKKEVELVPTTKPPSNNPTPNTTVDNAPVTTNHKAPPSSEAVEERKNTFLKDFARQVGETIPTEKTTETVAPVAQSEPKAPKEQKEESTPEAHTEQPESIPTEQPEAVPEPVVSVPEEPKKQASEEPAVPAVALESVAEVTSKLENVKIEEPEEVGSTEHPADPTQREDEDQESLLGAPDGFGAASSNYVEDVPEGDEDEEDVVSPEPNLEEEQRIREEEEAERLRQREIELDALQAELQLNKEECDEDIGYYGRSFMYCIRDIEKEFKRTEPPVPLDVLKNNHGIDIHSMPKNADNKKRTDFNPPWHNKGGSMQGNRQKPYAGGRHSQDHRSGGRGGGKQPYKSRNSIDRAPRAQLQHRADNAWKAEKIVDLDKEEAKIKKLLKDVRSLLNKITPTTKEDLIREFLTLQVAGPPPNFAAPEGQLTQVINIIFDKAVEEPRFCAIYSEICKRQVESELKVNNKQSPFRNAILSRSQDTFVSKTMDADKEAIDQEMDEDKKKEMLARWEEDYNKFRRRKFGNINFIGQLYEQQLMSTKIIQWCLYDLLRHSHPDANNKLPEPPYDEESIQCATQLMEAVGRSLENCRDFNGVGQYIEQIFSHFMSIAPNCSPKIKFKIYGVKELRDNQWRPRKVADQGPKKITEIHQDIQQEQQQQQQERDAYERRQGGGGVRQQSNSLRRPPPSRNSLDSRFSNPQNKRAAAGTASKLAPTNAAPRQMSMSITGGAGTQKKSWKTGAAGGGTSNSNIEAPGSRTIIQRQSGSREGSESRKSSQLGDRDAALAAARDIGGSKLNNKNSSSQLSVVSQEDQERIEAEKAEREEKQKKIANSIRSNLEELQAGDATEKEVVEDLFGYVDNTKYGSPDLPDVFQRFTESYVQKMSPQLRPIATKIIYNCLAQPEKKSDIIKGIENYCQWAINTEVYEDCPKLWDQLAELIVNLLLTTPETNPDEDIPKTEAKGASLNDFSPVFLAASEDDRPNKIYSLLIQTLRIMAEQLAKKGSENLMGLTMDFDDLSCRKELKEDKLTAALRSCNVDCVDFKNLYDVLNH